MKTNSYLNKISNYKLNLKNFFIFSLLTLINVSNIFSNDIYFFDLDLSKFPLISSKYVFLDNNQNSIKLNPSDKFNILDNNIVLETLTDTYNPETKYDYNQVVILFDLSIDTNKKDIIINSEKVSKSNFDIAKLIYQNIINNFDFNKNFISLFSFDYKNYPILINSTNKNELINVANELIGYRYASIDSAFNSNPLSINNIFDELKVDSLKNKNIKKTVLLLTDKNYNSIFNNEKFNQFSKILANNNINFVTGIIKNEISTELKELCFNSNEKNSGYYIDKMNLEDDENKINFYSKILSGFINGVKPSEYKWLGKYNCDIEHNVIISDEKTNSVFKFNYLLEDKFKPKFIIDKPFVNFSSILPGDFIEEEISFTADNTDIVISGFEIQRDVDSVFSITAGNIINNNPIIINKGQSHRIKIKYQPKDSTIIFIKLIAKSTACIGKEVLITGGFPNTPPKIKNVEIVTPQCQDILYVGDIHTVKWAGVLPKDVIQLEYSIDNGKTWDTLATNLTNLEYDWKVPDKLSENCLVRIIQLWPNNIGRTLTLNHNELLNSARFNTIGDKIVTTTKAGEVIVWNSNNGQKLINLVGHNSEVFNAEFSYGDRLIASASLDSSSKIWETNTGKLIADLKHKSRVNNAKFSRTGNYLVTASNDGFARIYNTQNWQLIKEFTPDNGQRLNTVLLTKDNKTIITAGSQGVIKFWNFQDLLANKSTLIKSFNVRNTNNIGNISQLTISPNEDRIAAVDILNKRCGVWNLKNDKFQFFINHSTFPVLNSSSFYYSNKDSFLITSGVDNRSILWNARTGDSLKIFMEHKGSVQTTFFNFDGSRVLTSSWDSTAKIWKLDQKDLQMDTSDCVFKIVKPRIKYQNINLGNCINGEYKDFNIANLFENASNFDLIVKDIRIEGISKDEFEIIELKNEFRDYFQNINNGRINPKLKNNDSLGITLRFLPLTLGNKEIIISIDLPGIEYKINVTANSIQNNIEIKNRYFDLGNVEIGSYVNYNVEQLLKSLSSNNIKIDNSKFKLMDRDNFKLLNSSKSNLNTNDNLDVNLRFIPLENKKSYTILEINHNGNDSPSKILLSGSGKNIKIDSLSISMNKFEGEVNNIVELELLVNKISIEELNSNINSITTKIKFNSTLLKPIGNFISDKIIGKERIIEVEVPLNNDLFKNTLNENQQFTILKIPFVVGLGNDTISNITIEQTTINSSGNIAIFENNTVFLLKGYCNEGGPRLFDSEGEINLTQNYPNPANEFTNIDFSVSESGLTKLSLNDIYGNNSFTIENSYLIPGKYNRLIDTKNLPSGVYNLILNTPTVTLIKRLIISH